MSIYVGKHAQIQTQKLRNLLRSKHMHDGNFPTTLQQPLVSEARRIQQSGPFDGVNIGSSRIGHSLKPHLEEVLIAAHRVKGVSAVGRQFHTIKRQCRMKSMHLFRKLMN